MPDPTDPLDQLHRLAPPIDADQAAVAFAGERVRRRRRRHLATGVVAAVLVALVAVPVALAVAGLGDDDAPVAATGDGSPTTDQPAPTGVLRFEVLDVLTETGEEMGTMRAALDTDTFAALWSSLGPSTPVPAVDFDRAFVLTITIPDDACPPTLEAFAAPENAFVPVFVEPQVDCEQPLIPKTFVSAIERDGLPDTVVFRLPADDVYRLSEHELLVDLAAGTVAGEHLAATTSAPEAEPLPGEPIDSYPFEGASLVAVGLDDEGYLEVYERPDPTTDVVAEVRWSDTGVVATGRNRRVDDVFWTEVRFQGTVGWAASQSLLQPLDAVDEVIDDLFPDPADRPVETDIGALALWVVNAIGEEPYTRVTTFDFPDDTTVPGSLRVDVIGFGDDAVGGVRLRIRADAQGDRLVLSSVEQRTLCRRGVSADGCL